MTSRILQSSWVSDMICWQRPKLFQSLLNLIEFGCSKRLRRISRSPVTTIDSDLFDMFSISVENSVNMIIMLHHMTTISHHITTVSHHMTKISHHMTTISHHMTTITRLIYQITHLQYQR